MILRVAIAAIGAVLVTGTLLLAMDAVTSLFENESGERYYRITDILPKPDPGRPERPRPQNRQPEIAEPEYERPDTNVPIEAPLPTPPGDGSLAEPELELSPPSGN